MGRYMDTFSGLYRAASATAGAERWVNSHMGEILEAIDRAIGRTPAKMIPYLIRSSDRLGEFVLAEPLRVIEPTREGYKVQTYSGGTSTVDYPFPDTIAKQRTELAKKLAQLTGQRIGFVREAEEKAATDTTRENLFSGIRNGYLITRSLNLVKIERVQDINPEGDRYVKVWTRQGPRVVEYDAVTTSEMGALLRFYRLLDRQIAEIAPPPPRVEREPEPKTYVAKQGNLERYQVIHQGASVSQHTTEQEAAEHLRKSFKVPADKPVYRFQDGAFSRIEETPDWYTAGTAFVDAETTWRATEKRRKGYKPSQNDYEIDGTLDMLRDILSLRPSQETEERFKAIKLHYLEISKPPARGRRR